MEYCARIKNRLSGFLCFLSKNLTSCQFRLIVSVYLLPRFQIFGEHFACFGQTDGDSNLALA